MLEAKYSRNNDNKTPDGESLGGSELDLWPAPTAHVPLEATVYLPGSKSLMARELILSALADGNSTISAPLESRDTQLMIDALAALGTRFEHDGDELTVIPPEEFIGSTTIACGLAGTVMRFMPAVATLALGPTAFDGDPYARKRPMKALIDSLRDLGADIADEGRGTLPFTVHGSDYLQGGYVEVDASASSQFVSALLLTAARFTNGVHVKHVGATLPSIPHIEMTIECLRLRGVEVEQPAVGEWVVKPGSIKARDLTLEPDLSNAAPFLAAAVAAGGSVTIPNWPSVTTQVGDQLRDLLPHFGAKVELSGANLTVTGDGQVKAVNLHVPHAGELSPTLVGLAALADGPSRITGIGHIRHHETDRISALAHELTAIGCEVTELNDGLEIIPTKSLNASQWNSYDDHRMATTGALIGLRVSGMEIINVASTAKTMPEFTTMWQKMVGLGELAEP